MENRNRKYLLALFLYGAISLSLPKPISADWMVTSDGYLIKSFVFGQILGEETQTEKDRGKISETSPAKTGAKTNAQKSEIESIKNKQESGIVNSTTSPNSKPSETPLNTQSLNRFADNNNAGSKTKLPSKSAEIKTGKTLLLDQKEGKLHLETATESGETENLGEQESLIINESRNKNSVKISTENENFVMEKDNVRAKTNLQLKVDLNDNSVSVKTSEGDQKIDVMPDEAVKKILESEVVNSVEKENSTQSSGLSHFPGKSKVELVIKDQKPVYEVQGESNKKLFGILPVTIRKKMEVSASTGVQKVIDESFVDKIKDLLSL